jgi:iron complex outermembrane receptor protein
MKKYWCIGICCTGFSLALGGGAVAQTTSGSDQLEAITVTANRRSENLQSVPIAVTAVTGDTMAKSGFTDTESFSEAVPGLNYNRQTNASTPFLRGVGTPVVNPGDEPSVAFFVDDVYVPTGYATLLNLDSNSIAGIEVDKGPQGTLFGRNATGGAIQVSTKDPSSTPAVDASLGYANYNTKSGSVYATGPLTNTLSANISVYGQDQSNGWGHNLTTGNASYTSWNFGGRAKLLWTPFEGTSLRLTVDHDTTRSEEGIGFHAITGTESAGPFPAPSGFFDSIENLDSHEINQQEGASLKAEQDLRWAQLISITAYRDSHAVGILDQDVGPAPIVNANLTTTDKAWTQEFRLVSKADGPVTWIAGFFYFNDLAAFSPLAFNGFAFSPPPFIDLSFYGLERTHSYAGFAQSTGTILNNTHITLGLRYTVDDRSITAFSNIGGFESPASNSPQSKSWPKLTERLSLDHNFTDDILAYVAYNSGFKSGVFNTAVVGGPGAPIDLPPANPETLSAYTAGIKNEFLDKRLRINAEAFLYKFKNIQVGEVITGVQHILNAAAATIKGIDLDVSALPMQNLTLTAAAEVLNGRYDRFPNGPLFTYNPVAGGNNVTFTNLAGDRTIQSPPFSFNLIANYQLPPTVGPFNLNVSYTHGGNYYFDSDNGRGQLSPSIDRQKLLNLVNASIGWHSASAKWGARLWGKNLTNEHYYSYGSESALVTEYSPAPPLTFGLTLEAHF